MLELLAPGGCPESVTAAVQNGADAVYIGFSGMTGCRNAVNFEDADFENTVRYCRTRGCKVYLAMNIQFRDEELNKAAGLSLRGQRAGVDAVILRDLGLFRILRKLMPEMPMFADAAMGFYTPADAAVAAQLGFQRIFLPPELPLSEIRRIREACGDKPEIGIIAQSELSAGAIGQSYLGTLTDRESESRGGHSDRGRERYSLGGRMDTTPLSFRSRCLLPQIRELEDMGIACVTFAGRDQRPEFTAAFTEIYRKAIGEDQQPAPTDWERLVKLFVPYGFAEKDIYEPADEAERKEEKPDRATEKFFSELRKSYTESELRRVPVSFAMVARSEQAPVRMGVQDGEGHRCLMDGPIPTPVGDMPLTEEALTEAMYRTAGTPYHCESVKVAAGEGMAISSSELDMARRSLLYKLSEERGRPPEKKEGGFPDVPRTEHYPELPVFNFRFETAEQMTPEIAEMGPCCVYAPIEVMVENPERLEPFFRAGATPVAELPSLLCGQDEENYLAELLDKLAAAGVKETSSGSLGVALLARKAGMELRGDTALGIWNSYALQNLSAAGFKSAMASFELSLSQIRRMPKPMDLELFAYGRLPVMTTQTCIIRASSGRCSCTIPAQMSDTHGGVWPVTSAFGCRNTVWGAQKLWLGDKVREWISCGLWAVRLSFSTESPRECYEVADSYLHGTGYHPNGMTRGLYYRGVQ